MSKEPPETKGCETPSIYKCAYPAPYPEVRVAGPNPKYAQLLLEDYAGMVSEMTAVTQYSYHHFVLEDENREAADLLSCIALVEMHHLEILAETILLLGVDPRYRTIERNNAERYWDATFVFYGTALCDRLTADVASEWADELTRDLGIDRSPLEQVIFWAQEARECGLSGVVASPKEISAIREHCGRDFLIVTPGIRPAGFESGDQKRVSTPGDAVRSGVDYIVVGRPILQVQDPRQAALDIVREMEEAIK
jgi:bacterioferritin